MSVPSWQRELSGTQYIYDTFDLCVDIGHIVAAAPKKYRENYGDRLITYSLDCLKYCRLANAIYMTKDTSKEDYLLRRHYLQTARTLSYHIATTMDVFLTLCMNVDGAKQEKIERTERRIGTKCATIRNLIGGVLKSDRGIYGKKTG